MNTRSMFWRAALACAFFISSLGAGAGPVVQPGSSWELYLTQASTPNGVLRRNFTFDGVAESFVHQTAGGATLTVMVQETQADLGLGRSSIDLMLSFSGSDPYPNAGQLAGIGVGVVGTTRTGAPLQLTDAVALVGARASALAGNGDALDLDLLPTFQSFNQAAPWNGRMFDGYFLGLPWGGRALQQLTLHFETQALNTVSSPGTLPLLALGLLAVVPSLRRRAR